MQTRRLKLNQKPARRGFTLIELLVVISIIATLMSLILPAIQNARAAARTLECKNNLKNLALAAHSFASSKNSLPALGVYAPPATGTQPRALRSWVVDLLPYLERRDIADRWNNAETWDDSINSTNSALGANYIKVLACPDDPSASGVNGGLRYVGNNGYFRYNAANAVARYNRWPATQLNWDGDPITNTTTPGALDRDKEDATAQRDTGVFWSDFGTFSVSNNGTRERQLISHKIDSMYDGSAQTILFTENVNSGGSGSWADPLWTNVGFAYIVNGAVSATNTYQRPEAYLSPLGVNVALPNKSNLGPEANTASATVAPLVGSAGPNSAHRGGVNAAFADGSVRFINDSVGPIVFAQLVSPSGAVTRTNTTIPSQDPLSDNGY